jgi:magnesium transporter
VESLERPYPQTTYLQMMRKRAGWLTALFFSEMLTATALGHYEDEIQRAVVLSLFLTLIASAGGNSGSQSTALIVRAIALGELRLRDWWMVLRRELLNGLSLGILLGSIGFLRVVIWAKVFHMYGPYYHLLAATIGLTLVCVVLWGTISGAMLPFIVARVGQDPAVASAPFVATFVDVTAIIIYFQISKLLLDGMLL